MSHPPMSVHVTMQEFLVSQSELLEARCCHSDTTVTAADGVAIEISEGENRGEGKQYSMLEENLNEGR